MIVRCPHPEVPSWSPGPLALSHAFPFAHIPLLPPPPLFVQMLELESYRFGKQHSLSFTCMKRSLGCTDRALSAEPSFSYANHRDLKQRHLVSGR